MFWIVLPALLLLGGIATLFAIPRRRWIGASVIGITVVTFVLAGINWVPVKNVGVEVSLGQVQGVEKPGPLWLLPWKSLVNIPETVQTNTWSGGFNKEGTACVGALDVRIGGQQHACLDATIQWQVLDSAAPKLFNNFNTPGVNVLSEIKTAVVIREFEVAANQILGDYNPIQDVAVVTGAGNSQFTTFTPALKALMIKDIGSQIKIHSVLLKFLHYDPATQAVLHKIQQQYAATAIAKQAIITNQAQALANAAVAKVTGPELIAQCLSIAKEEGVPPGGCITGAAASIAIGK